MRHISVQGEEMSSTAVIVASVWQDPGAPGTLHEVLSDTSRLPRRCRPPAAGMYDSATIPEPEWQPAAIPPSSAVSRGLRTKIPEKDLIALPRKGEVLLCEPSCIMRRELQRHLVIANVDIRMVPAFLSFPRNPVDKINTLQESCKCECPKNRLATFRPTRNDS